MGCSTLPHRTVSERHPRLAPGMCAGQIERSFLMPLLDGKKALIFGIANHRSIGWAIAQSLAAEGAQLAFSYQERMEKYVRDLAAKIPGTEVMECDVQSDEQLDSAFARAGEIFHGELDILIHSVAYAPQRDFCGSTQHSGRPRCLWLNPFSRADESYSPAAP